MVLITVLGLKHRGVAMPTARGPNDEPTHSPVRGFPSPTWKREVSESIQPAQPRWELQTRGPSPPWFSLAKSSPTARPGVRDRERHPLVGRSREGSGTAQSTTGQQPLGPCTPSHLRRLFYRCHRDSSPPVPKA